MRPSLGTGSGGLRARAQKIHGVEGLSLGTKDTFPLFRAPSPKIPYPQASLPCICMDLSLSYPLSPSSLSTQLFPKSSDLMTPPSSPKHFPLCPPLLEHSSVPVSQSLQLPHSFLLFSCPTVSAPLSHFPCLLLCVLPSSQCFLVFRVFSLYPGM